MTRNNKICPVRLYPKELVLENFRSFKDVKIPLGKNITVVSGVNGVGKSNILSLIASGSGINKKSILGSKFQPEFYDFFNIDTNENYKEYNMILKYADSEDNFALAKRLSFKDDSTRKRGIRIIPRTTNGIISGQTVAQASKDATNKYGIGGSGRVLIPTIYLSLSRLYPLGEKKLGSAVVSKIRKTHPFAKKEARAKYREWYNTVISGAIKEDAEVSIIKKKACSRASVHMDIQNTPTLSQSIGQDNIGNIISALIDIYLLSLDSEYKGALLCIDEIEVSLHPDTQINLLNLIDRLSEELKLQVVLSTHSLTVLKESLKKEHKNSEKYKVIYLKNPLSPYVTEIKSYELLKADLFGSLEYNKVKVRIYFEDEVGQELFNELTEAYMEIYNAVKDKRGEQVLRNAHALKDHRIINDKIIECGPIDDLCKNLKQVVTHCGCEELFDISNADEILFKRIIIMLDGDARTKTNKPNVRDYLENYFNPKEFGISERKHPVNIIFAPGYFAPESFLYKMIYQITEHPENHNEFWRALDRRDNTALYTADKIKKMFNNLPTDFKNSDLKKIFRESPEGELWDFIKMANVVKYYFFDYEKIEVLINFVNDLKHVYGITEPLTVENRWI